MMLTIWLTLPASEVVKVGELAIDEPDARGALDGQFRYDPEYMENPKAFPLDPLHLPLSGDIFNADRPHAGVHGVFEDSLPDDWGRRLLVRRYKLDRSNQRIPQLLRLLAHLFDQKNKSHILQHVTFFKPSLWHYFCL